MPWDQFISALIIVMGLDIVYTRMEAVNREVAHILTMLALVIVAIMTSSESIDLKNEIHNLKKEQKIRVELSVANSSDLRDMVYKLDTLSLSLDAEVASEPAEMDK